jgi:hypothetical protein
MSQDKKAKIVNCKHIAFAMKNGSTKYKLDTLEEIQAYVQSMNDLLNYCLKDKYISNSMLNETIEEMWRKNFAIDELLDNIVTEDILKRK